MNRPSPAEHDTPWVEIRQAILELEAAGVDSPRLTAEVILARVLNWERPRLIARLHDRGILSEAGRHEFRMLIRRRAAGEPLQYLTGEQEFYGLAFLVTPAVLIPRPETEILVEKAVALARGCPGGIRFADVGTGSGCIAVALARTLPDSRGWGADISMAALAVARENARRHGVAARVGFVNADLLEAFPARPGFDIILSNPPYVSALDAPALPGHVRDHEPHTALFAGNSGTEIYRRLVPQAVARLAPAGYLLLEIGCGQADAVTGIVLREGLSQVEVFADLQGIPRCLAACRMKAAP